VNSPDNAATGGIFKDANDICIACFAQNLGPDNALFGELHVAIEVATSKDYTYTLNHSFKLLSRS
jgi:hypothetical protein